MVYLLLLSPLSVIPSICLYISLPPSGPCFLLSVLLSITRLLVSVSARKRKTDSVRETERVLEGLVYTAVFC